MTHFWVLIPHVDITPFLIQILSGTSKIPHADTTFLSVTNFECDQIPHADTTFLIQILSVTSKIVQQKFPMLTRLFWVWPNFECYQIPHTDTTFLAQRMTQTKRSGRPKGWQDEGAEKKY